MSAAQQFGVDAAHPERPSTASTASSRRVYVFTGLYSAVLYTVLLVAPVIAGPIIEKFQLEPEQVGILFSIELGAFSLATVPAYLWLTRLPLAPTVAVFTVLVAIGHAMSAVAGDFGTLLVTRGLTSLAAGSITVVLLALGPRTANPGRAFGIFVVAQLAMGALILALFPVVFQGAGLAPIYLTLAVLTALCTPAALLIRGMHLGAPADAGSSVAAARPNLLRFAAGLLSILLFYIALSGVWTFMGQIGASAGIAEGPTSLTLSVATVAGIVSALLATLLGDRPYSGALLVASLAGMGIAIALLLGTPALIQFAIAAILFKFTWTLVLPYLLSALSALGGGAHTMNTVNLMIGGGFALGPLVAGFLIGASGGFTSMLIVSLAAIALALVLTLVLLGGRLRVPTSPDVPGGHAADGSTR